MVPAARLLNATLPGGWRVVEHLQRAAGETGGCFSERYIVENSDGKKAFLKALDFSMALRSPDFPRALQALLEAYNFERDLLEHCTGLDRVVLAIADGQFDVDPSNDIGRVPYIIFQLADGDVRGKLRADGFDLAWSLRAMHHIAVGLSQLHGRGVAHQDLKPSNVMVFPTYSKIGDLGRASSRAFSPQYYEDDPWAGDPTYAPPELLYGQVPDDWSKRRLGCDMYLLGSMIAFFFSGLGMTAMVQTELHESMRSDAWRGTYQEVLPYLRAAFDTALGNVSAAAPESIRGEVEAMVRQLCEPDPARRGHPKNVLTTRNQFGLERFVSGLNVLAERAELELRRQ